MARTRATAATASAASFPAVLVQLRALTSRPHADAELLTACDHYEYLSDHARRLFDTKPKRNLDRIRGSLAIADRLRAKIATLIPTTTTGRIAKAEVALRDLEMGGAHFDVARSIMRTALKDMREFEGQS